MNTRGVSFLAGAGLASLWWASATLAPYLVIFAAIGTFAALAIRLVRN